VRVKNPHLPSMGSDADPPFWDMDAPCVSKAGIAVYSWNGPGAPHQVVKHSVADRVGPENV
jgi:hypothetical protein